MTRRRFCALAALGFLLTASNLALSIQPGFTQDSAAVTAFLADPQNLLKSYPNPNPNDPNDPMTQMVKGLAIANPTTLLSLLSLVAERKQGREAGAGQGPRSRRSGGCCEQSDLRKRYLAGHHENARPRSGAGGHERQPHRRNGRRWRWRRLRRSDQLHCDDADHNWPGPTDRSELFCNGAVLVHVFGERSIRSYRFGQSVTQLQT